MSAVWLAALGCSALGCRVAETSTETPAVATPVTRTSALATSSAVEPAAPPTLELASLDGGWIPADPQTRGTRGREDGHRFGHLGSPPGVGVVPGGYQGLGFDGLLAPDWAAPNALESGPRPPLAEVLPAEILAADGRQVALEGFAVALDGRGADSRRWLLSPAPDGCCSTGPATFDQFVWVELAEDPGWNGDPYSPVRVAGRFRVEELSDDFGFLESLYRLDEAHRIQEPDPARARP